MAMRERIRSPPPPRSELGAAAEALGTAGRWTWGLTLAAAALLVWAPLPFGSVTRGSRALLLGALFLLAAFAVWEKGGATALRAVRWPCMALVAVALLGLLQSVTWPLTWVERLSPELVALASTLPEGVAREEGRIALSMTPEASRDAALTFFGVATALGLGAILGRHWQQRRLLVSAIVVGGLVEVVLGAATLGADQIWGIDVPVTSSRLRGSFVNANHFSLYLLLAVAPALAWLTHSLTRSESVGWEKRIERSTIPILVLLALVAGVMYSGSRSALAAFAALVAVQVLLTGARRRTRVVALLLVLVTGGLLLRAEGLPAVSRANDTAGHEITTSSRVETYRATADLFRRFPILGTGLGSFRDALSLTERAPTRVFWRHAHNDYLETLAVAGVVGFLLLCSGLIPGVVTLRRVVKNGSSLADRLTGAAALAALAAAAVHALFDFGLTMPANSLSLALLCGAAAAPAGSSPALERAVLSPTLR